jgi:hypothetical protein
MTTSGLFKTRETGRTLRPDPFAPPASTVKPSNRQTVKRAYLIGSPASKSYSVVWRSR